MRRSGHRCWQWVPVTLEWPEERQDAVQILATTAVANQGARSCLQAASQGSEKPGRVHGSTSRAHGPYQPGPERAERARESFGPGRDGCARHCRTSPSTAAFLVLLLSLIVYACIFVCSFRLRAAGRGGAAGQHSARCASPTAETVLDAPAASTSGRREADLASNSGSGRVAALDGYRTELLDSLSSISLSSIDEMLHPPSLRELLAAHGTDADGEDAVLSNSGTTRHSRQHASTSGAAATYELSLRHI